MAPRRDRIPLRADQTTVVLRAGPAGKLSGMSRERSLADIVVWLVISATTLVIFVPTALSTVAGTTDWSTTFVDGGEVTFPTWFTFGMNCGLVFAAAVLALATAGLLIRRLRRGAGPEAGPAS